MRIIRISYRQTAGKKWTGGGKRNTIKLYIVL